MNSENSFDPARGKTLTSAIERHLNFEKASFHTPGHKGRLLPGFDEIGMGADLTELPGLDELANPEGVLLDLERRAAQVWQSHASLISVNGASAGIIAAMLAVSGQKKKFLLPRNAHRSAINALIIGGIEPIWYEPAWNARFGCWGHVSVNSIKDILTSVEIEDVAGMLVVSPTYPGSISDISSLSELCHSSGIPLIVDEAHGAHLLGSQSSSSAVNCGADITVHSLHKTLSALTQTGMIHVSQSPYVTVAQVRAQLNLLHSSSPSYLLMHSIERCVTLLEETGIELIQERFSFKSRLEKQFRSEYQFLTENFESDPFHILVQKPGVSAEELYEFCCNRGVFPEAILGNGVLFLVGIGNDEKDFELLLHTLADFVCIMEEEERVLDEITPWHFTETEQVMSPRTAFMAPSEVVAVEKAIGRIAAECVAPCPPGIPVCVPGQKIHPEVMNLPSVKNLRVVSEPSE